MVKVVAIKCPSCMGKKTRPFAVCDWCGGNKKLRRADALRWAAQSICIGSGGYICGDHDWDDRCRMVNEGNAVRKVFGLEPRP